MAKCRLNIVSISALRVLLPEKEGTLSEHAFDIFVTIITKIASDCSGLCSGESVI